MAGIETAKRIGGRLCLDFVNTVGGRVAAPGTRGRHYADRIVGERLVSYAALLRWSVLAGSIASAEARVLARTAVERPARGTVVLARALALRETLFRVFKAVIEDWKPAQADLALLNRELRRARNCQQLVAGQSFAWRWEKDTTRALDRVLWPVAASAAELLTAPELLRLRQCPGDECGWLFLDTSRSGRRRWCDMADCGNLAKVRRFRQRPLQVGKARAGKHRL